MNVSSDFVSSYLDAWNQHDPVGVAEHLAMGGTYCDVPTHQRPVFKSQKGHNDGCYQKTKPGHDICNSHCSKPEMPSEECSVLYGKALHHKGNGQNGHDAGTHASQNQKKEAK